jgi:hypothetical protein
MTGWVQFWGVLGSFGVWVVVSIRLFAQASADVLVLLAECVRSSPCPWPSVCAAERIYIMEAEGGWEHTLHARTRTRGEYIYIYIYIYIHIYIYIYI